MRRLLRLGGTLLALGALAWVGWSWSEARPAAPPQRLRVGLVNLWYVLEHCEENRAFRMELKALWQPFQDRETELNSQAEALAKELPAAGTTAERRAALEAKLNALRSELEDNKSKWQAIGPKRQQEQQKALLEDLLGAAQRYAVAHDLDLVLPFWESSSPADYWDARSIGAPTWLQRRRGVPLYAAPGLDITQGVVDAMNEAWRRRKEG